MKKEELVETMKSFGFHPSKNLGQNFLTDENMLASIVRLADVQSTDRILEIGPGFAALTRHLVATGADVTAIEFDYRLASWLRNHFQDTPNFRLVEGDAVCVNYAEIMGDQPYKIVANLPYSISTPFVMTMLMLANPPQSMTLMLQKEVAERFCAKPGVKAYGASSILLQSGYECIFEKVVPPKLFMPPPDVDSAVITMKARDPFPSIEDRTQLQKIVKSAFLQRRKKMAGVLGNLYGRPRVEAALETLGIRVDARAEILDYQQFIALKNILLQPVVKE